MLPVRQARARACWRATAMLESQFIGDTIDHKKIDTESYSVSVNYIYLT